MDAINDDAAFEAAIEKAREQGRIDSPHRCCICGMGFLTKEQAVECCANIIDSLEPDLRRDGVVDATLKRRRTLAARKEATDEADIEW